MKELKYIIIALLFFSFSAKAQHQTWVPDINFEIFLEANGMGNGDDHDGWVFTSNITSVTSLVMGNLNISDLTGIEAFSSLRLLVLGAENNITSLDLSNNTALTQVFISGNPITSLNINNLTNLTSLDVGGADFTSLDVSGLTALENLYLVESKISSIDVSNNAALKTIHLAKTTNITTVDLKSNTNLQSVNIFESNIVSVDLRNGNNTNISSFNAWTMPNLDCISVDNVAHSVANWTANGGTSAFSPACYSTYVPDDSFESLLEGNGMGDGIANNNYVLTANISSVGALTIENRNVSDLTGIEDFLALQHLFLDNNNVTNINLSNPNLTWLSIERNPINTLDLSNLTNLFLLIFEYNDGSLNSLDVSNNTALSYFNLIDSNITSLDVSNNPALGRLDLTNTPNITSLDLRSNPNLQTLILSNNNALESVDFRNGNNTAITTFEANNTPNLSCFNVDNTSYATARWTVNGSTSAFAEHCNESYIPDDNFEGYLEANGMGNGIANDDYVLTTSIASVTSLNIASQNISDLTGIANFTALETLDVRFNNLTTIDVTANTNLKVLFLRDNDLTSINVSGLTALETIGIKENPTLTTLDLSSLTALSNLGVANTGISSLDLSNNTALFRLDLENTSTITNLDLTNNASLTELLVSNTNLESIDLQNGNNTIITTFSASNMPNLACISVDNEAYAVANWTANGSTSYFSEYCFQTYVPDNNFEAFLEANGMGNGIANDDYVSTPSISSVTTLNISNQSISDLTGIADFTALENLQAVGNTISSIDLTANTNLEEVSLRFNASLSAINTSTLTALKVLNIQGTTITTLDLSNNTLLESLTARDADLTSLDVSMLPLLRYLSITGCSITDLDLTNNPALYNFYAYNGALENLNLKNGNNLTLIGIGITNNPNLRCVNVDDATHSTNNWGDKDATTSYSENCYETYVPDNNFEAFLEANGMGDGIANNDLVTTANISSVTSLNIGFQNISNLTGIERFYALETLDARGNNLTSIDVSTNTALTFLNIQQNSISGIDLSALLSLEHFNAYSTPLTSIDVSNNTALAFLNVHNTSVSTLDLSNNTALTQLYARNAMLTSLNVKNGNNTNMTIFQIQGNTNLFCALVDDVAHANTNFTNKEATTIYSETCGTTNVPDDNFEAFLEANGMGNSIANDNLVYTDVISSVTSLNITSQSISDLTGIEAFTALEGLDASSNSLTSIDVSSNTALTYLSIRVNNGITGIDVSALTSLETLDAYNTSLANIDVSNNTALKILQLNNTDISSLNLSSNTALERLSIRSLPGLTNIDLSNNTALYILDVQNAHMPTLDLSNNTALIELYAKQGAFTSLNVKNGNNTNMTVFDIQGNTSLFCVLVDDVAHANTNFTNKETTTIYSETCGTTNVPDDNFEAFLEANGMGNGIANDNLVFTDNISSVTSLNIASQSISDLTGIAGFIALETLDASSNNLTSIDVSTNTALTSLNIRENASITGIDVSALTSLEVLDIHNTSLASIDVSNNTALQTLQLNATSITSLDVSSNTALKIIDLGFTNVTSIDLSNNPNLEEIFLYEMPSLQTINFKNGNNTNITRYWGYSNPNLSCINVDNVAYAMSNWIGGANSVLAGKFSEHCFETYVPDDNFEAFLEANGMGNGIANDDYVTTTNISSVTSLNLNSQSISDLTGIEAFTALESLEASFNNLTSIDVSNNTGLTYLNIRGNNGVTGIDVSVLTSLETLIAYSTSLASIDVSNNTALKTLQLNDTDISSLDVSSNTALESLSIRFLSGLTSIDLSNNVALTHLDVQDAAIATLDLSNNTGLTELYARRGVLTSLNVKNGNNTNITDFQIQDNASLFCVLVDNVAYANTNFTNKEAATIYSETCGTTNVPDDNFEAFLEANNMGNGVANDNLVFTDNISSVTSLDISGQSVSDLTGIEGFIALRIFTANTNSLTDVDLSNNANLTQAIMVNNPYTSVNVSGLTDLTHLFLSSTVPTENLTSLDVSSNIALEVLGLNDLNIATIDVSNNNALERLSLENTTNITSVDLRNNPNLNTLELSNSALESVDLRNGNNTSITTFSAASTSNLSCVNVDNTAYAVANWTVNGGTSAFAEHCNETYVPDNNFEAYLEANGMGDGIANNDYVLTASIETATTIDLENNAVTDMTGVEAFTALETLWLHNNSGLTSIDVSNNTNLKDLRLRGTSINSIDVSNLTSLETLQLTDTNISSLDVSSNTALELLQIGNIPGLTSIDLSNNTALYYLDVQDAAITTLDLSNNTALTELYARRGLFTSLNVKNGNNTNVTQFYVTTNPNLSCITVDDAVYSTTNWTNIPSGTSFSNYCGGTYVPDDNFEAYLETNGLGNGIANDDYVLTTSISSIRFLTMIDQNISDLTGIEAFTALERLNVKLNNLSTIDLSANTALERLEVSSNNLSTVDLSANTALTMLKLNVNPLITSVDVSHLNLLEELELPGTGITAVNVSNNTALKKIDVGFTNITSLDLSNNPNLEDVLFIEATSLLTVNLQNGNNDNIHRILGVLSPNITCVNVDSGTSGTSSPWNNSGIDANKFSAHCFETYVPDNNFEAFLEARGMGNGIANDDYVTTANISSVPSLNIFTQSISDLTGIEGFIALESLDASFNYLTSIDVSNNTALTYLNIRQNTAITGIDVSALSSLESLDTYNTSLTSIDVSNNTALISLNVHNTSVSTLDLSNNTALTQLHAQNGALTSLNVKNGNNTNMTVFNIQGNTNLLCVTVDNVGYANTNFTNKEATTFYSETCGTTNVPDANFETFLEANGMGNGIANDNLVYTDVISSVTSLDISNQNISDLTGIEAFTSLGTLDVGNNNITSIALTNLSQLGSLSVDDNPITSLDISANTSIVTLTLRNTAIASLDMSNQIVVNLLDISGNTGITSLDLSHTSFLGNITAQNTVLESLNVKNGVNGPSTLNTIGSTSLTCVLVDNPAYAIANWTDDVEPNTFFNTTCDVTNIPDDNFEAFLEANGMGDGVANNNYVITANISAVTSLDISNQSISDLTGIAGFTALEILDARNNNITTMDVSANTSLTTFYLNGASITSLNLTSNTALETIGFLNLNNLTILDLSNNTSLEHITLLGLPSLEILDVKNGNNTNITTFSLLNTNPCINVDSVTYSQSNWVIFNPNAYSEHCNDTYVPDNSFEAFLEANGMGNGIANDDYVTTANISSVTSLDISNQSITDLTGIEGFTSLEVLNAGNNNISTVDFSSNTALKDLNLESNTGITAIDVSHLNSLEEITLDGTNIRVVDLSNNSNIKRIYLRFMDSLVSVNLKNGHNSGVTHFFANDSNNLTCVNVDSTNYPRLDWSVQVDDTGVFSRDCFETYVPDNNFEGYLEANGMGNGVANDDYVITANISAVTSLDISNQSISDLTGIQGFTALETLDVRNNNLTSIDVSANTSLKDLNIEQNSISGIDVSTLLSLESFNAYNTSLTSINVSNNTALTFLNVHDTSVSTLDLSSNTALTQLYARNAALTSLNVKNGNNTNMTVFQIQGNTSLFCVLVDNVGYANTNFTNKESTTIYSETCGTTNIPGDNFEAFLEANNMGNGIANDNLVFTDNISSVISLNIASQSISDLTGIAGFTALEILDARFNNLTTIDVTTNTNLKALLLRDNDLTAINASGLTTLETIGVKDNPTLTTLDLSSLTALGNLGIANTSISSLDLSNNTALFRLDVENTSTLTNLDLTNNASLTDLLVSNTNLESIDLQNGNNTIITTFSAANTPNITCVNVDNTAYAVANWTVNGSTSVFGEHCNETYVPDNNFEAFLEANGMGNGIANDDYVLTTNISSVTSLNISRKSISDITGIEGFTSLEVLNAGDNAISTVDFSSNTALRELNLEKNTSITNIDVLHLNSLEEITLNETNIRVVDLSNNPNLTDVSLSAMESLVSVNLKNGNNPNIDYLRAWVSENVMCINVDNLQYAIDNWSIYVDNPAVFSVNCFETYVPDNNFEAFLEANGMGNGVANDDYVITANISAVTSLDISNQSISDLTGIEAFTSLQTLIANNNSFSSIDVSALTSLQVLNVASTSITDLNLTTHTALTQFYAQNSVLTSLDFRNGANTNMTNFNTTGSTNLLCVQVDNAAYATTNWTDVDVQTVFSEACGQTSIPDNNFEAFLEANNMGNGIANDNLVFTDKVSSVTSLDISNQSISNLSGIEAFTALQTLNVGDNNLSSVNVSSNTNLTTLNLKDNASISTIDISTLTSLEVLNIESTGISTIDIRFNSALTNINVSDSPITSLDLTNHTDLAQLNVSNSPITSLDLNYVPALKVLDISNTSISNLYIDNNPLLERLDLEATFVTTLDISNHPLLQVLDISATSINSLDLSNNTDLQELNIGVTPITTLDLSTNTALENLNMFQASVTNLDLSNNTALTNLFAIDGALESIDLRNGTNTSITNFQTQDNSNLTCIQVDDVAYSTTNWTDVDVHTSFSENGCGVVLSAKVFLHGAYDSASSMMRADLGSARIPTNTPHSDGVTASSSVFDVTGNNAIVDWVYVELRDKDDITNVLYSSSALLQRDGDIVGIDGTSPLTIVADSGDYYIAVLHRNHIPIATDITFSLSSTTTVVDLTQLSNIRGGSTGTIEIHEGRRAMFGGDFNGDGQIDVSDLVAGLSQGSLGESGYRTTDVNLDGQVQTTELVTIVVAGIGKGKQF